MRRLSGLILVSIALLAVGCSGGDASATQGNQPEAPTGKAVGGNQPKGMGGLHVTPAGSNVDSRFGTAGKN
jgi:hypothetical protein